MASKRTCGEVVKAFACELKSPRFDFHLLLPVLFIPFHLQNLVFGIKGLGGKKNNTLTFKTTREDQ